MWVHFAKKSDDFQKKKWQKLAWPPCKTKSFLRCSFITRKKMSSQAATQNLVQSKYETCAHSLIMHEWQQDVIWKWTCNPSAKKI